MRTTQLAKSQQTERLHTIELTKLQSKFEVSELDGQKLRERLQEEEGLAAAEINKVATVKICYFNCFNISYS